MRQCCGERRIHSTYPDTVGGGRGKGNPGLVKIAVMKAPNNICGLYDARFGSS